MFTQFPMFHTGGTDSEPMCSGTLASKYWRRFWKKIVQLHVANNVLPRETTMVTLVVDKASKPEVSRPGFSQPEANQPEASKP